VVHVIVSALLRVGVALAQAALALDAGAAVRRQHLDQLEHLLLQLLVALAELLVGVEEVLRERSIIERVTGRGGGPV
jgi:hypothetical protein